MTCQYPNCPNEAKHQMYFLLRKEPSDTPEVARSKPYWQVCDEHSSMSLDDIVQLAAQSQLIDGFADNERQMEAKYELSGIMTEVLP